MCGLKSGWPWKLALAMMLLSLTGCASVCPPTPPVVAEPVRLTPLPPSIKQIDLKASAAYSTKVSNYLWKVDSLLNAETPR